MTDPRSGHRSQLIIWAAAEARRLRHEAAPVDETVARPTTTPTAESQVGRRVAADAWGVVLDWQLSVEPAHESSA